MKHLLATALSALLLLSLCACGTGLPPAVSGGSGSSPAESGSSTSQQAAPVLPTNEERAAELLEQMTLEEKVGQLFFARVPESNALEDVTTYHLGGYILFGRDTKDKTANEIIQNINSWQESSEIPLLIGVDEEGGSVVRVSSNPKIRSEKFRSPQQLDDAGGMDAILKDTHEKDILLKGLGINVNLAPVADVSTNSEDFIYSRTLGKDAAATAEYVSAVVKQMRTDGMGCVLKHFPGYGNNVDTHTGIAVDNRPIKQFKQSDFLPFSAGLKAGEDTVAVLVNHNIIKNIDATLPASLSPAVHDELRKLEDAAAQRGVVMTDDLVMDAVKSYAENGSVAVLAIQAGNDLLIASDYREQVPQVIEAVNSGSLDESAIDLACAQVLQWKMALGLL